MIEFLGEKIKEIDKNIKEIATNISEIMLLTTIPGVGIYSATLIYAEIGEIEEICVIKVERESSRV